MLTCILYICMLLGRNVESTAGVYIIGTYRHCSYSNKYHCRGNNIITIYLSIYLYIHAVYTLTNQKCFFNTVYVIIKGMRWKQSLTKIRLGCIYELTYYIYILPTA